MIENKSFSSKKIYIHLLINLTIWCTNTLKFFGVL